MVANKYPLVRSAICWSDEITRLSRLHNNANIIALPARFISPEEALNMVKIFFTTEFEDGRHERRVQKIPIPVK
jgi:ribose 5-phosphate isomerase B